MPFAYPSRLPPVESISNHAFRDWETWGSKLRRIIEVLRGEGYPFLEFYSRRDLDAFVTSLQEAAETVLPKRP